MEIKIQEYQNIVKEENIKIHEKIDKIIDEKDNSDNSDELINYHEYIPHKNKKKLNLGYKLDNSLFNHNYRKNMIKPLEIANEQVPKSTSRRHFSLKYFNGPNYFENNNNINNHKSINKKRLNLDECIMKKYKSKPSKNIFDRSQDQLNYPNKFSIDKINDDYNSLNINYKINQKINNLKKLTLNNTPIRNNINNIYDNILNIHDTKFNYTTARNFSRKKRLNSEENSNKNFI